MKHLFVKEAIRGIRKIGMQECSIRDIERTIVLVSEDFLYAAEEELDGVQSDFPSPLDLSRDRKVFIGGMLVLSVPWISDYEFEIRPPGEKK